MGWYYLNSGDLNIDLINKIFWEFEAPFFNDTITNNWMNISYTVSVASVVADKAESIRNIMKKSGNFS